MLRLRFEAVAAVGELIEAEELEVAAVVIVVAVGRKAARGRRTARLTSTHTATGER